MNIAYSITAGRILSLLESHKQPVSLEGLVYYLEESFSVIRNGVQRLVREGLVVFDVEKGFLCIQAMPDFDPEIKSKKESYLHEAVCA